MLAATLQLPKETICSNLYGFSVECTSGVDTRLAIRLAGYPRNMANVLLEDSIGDAAAVAIPCSVFPAGLGVSVPTLGFIICAGFRVRHRSNSNGPLGFALLEHLFVRWVKEPHLNQALER